MRYAKPLRLYQDLLKLDVLKQRRVLGLSIGADSYRNNCVGIAISDLHGELVEPCCVFDRKEHDISHISSRLHDMALKVKLFVENLSMTGNLKMVPYTFWGEEDLYAKLDFGTIVTDCVIWAQRIQCIEDPFSFDPIAAKRLSDKEYAASGMIQDYPDTMKNDVKK
ncbi:pre-16S rRNA nuclease [Artemisia annua]|uniref:Pre-16S rRNA nuclease n=1 Tax=Artemisia annua TaxID=35608 RepID=A0A2U1QJA5_ARTAN|nr:pre-16S rRNA nuclease [Artemisia annua]